MVLGVLCQELLDKYQTFILSYKPQYHRKHCQINECIISELILGCQSLMVPDTDLELMCKCVMDKCVNKRPLPLLFHLSFSPPAPPPPQIFLLNFARFQMRGQGSHQQSFNSLYCQLLLFSL